MDFTSLESNKEDSRGPEKQEKNSAWSLWTSIRCAAASQAVTNELFWRRKSWDCCIMRHFLWKHQERTSSFMFIYIFYFVSLHRFVFTWTFLDIGKYQKFTSVNTCGLVISVFSNFLDKKKCLEFSKKNTAPDYNSVCVCFPIFTQNINQEARNLWRMHQNQFRNHFHLAGGPLLSACM